MSAAATPSIEHASILTGIRGEHVTLTDVAVSAVLRDLLAEVTITQSYRNAEPVNIEAVYTFPLPLDGVLLDLEVEIGGRRLTGSVVEKRAAERRYEEAVSEGDSAVMLEVAEPGLYTMNVGNLLAGETAKIRFTYALLQRWSGDELRIHLPTTIAPRYGVSLLLPHQVTESSLTVENQFSLRMEVRGTLRDARFECPTHPVVATPVDDALVISFARTHAVMDRDFVLNVKAPRAERSFVACGRDGKGVAAIASFQPRFPGLRQPRALSLAIVIDCSGSMAGISMQQAKQALDNILERLQPDDRLVLVAFGSTVRTLWHRPLTCTATNVARARAFAAALDADMGGTEIGAALAQATASLGEDAAGDILLITDGNVGAWQPVTGRTSRAAHRVFSVGVGSAVSEAFLRTLANESGGACELVSPREGMAQRIVRHFERMRAPHAKRVQLHWPAGAVDSTPAAFLTVFEGDTILASARFEHVPDDRVVTLEIESDLGDVVQQRLALDVGASIPGVEIEDEVSSVARLAAAMRLPCQAHDAARDTALRYRLISAWTHWLVIASRAEGEKPTELPELRKVPQTLAAGWGGTGMPVVRDDLRMSIDYSHAFEFARREAEPMRPRSARTAEEQRRSAERSAIVELKRREAERMAQEMRHRAEPFGRQAALDASRPFDWREAYRRTLSCIELNAVWLDLNRAEALLRQTNLWNEVRTLWDRSGGQHLPYEKLAAILIERLLCGSRGAPLAPMARAKYESLCRIAREAYAAISDAELRRDVDAALERIDRELAPTTTEQPGV